MARVGAPWGHLVQAVQGLRFGAAHHIWSANGCAEMPLTGAVTPGEAFYCPHCGALYAVTHSPRTVSDSNIVKCVVCLSTMDERKSNTARIYKLIHRPEDA